MASQKVTSILVSKTDMRKEEIAALSDSDAWDIVYSMRVKKAEGTRLQICFTGFGDSRENELTKLAQDKKFKVVASVTNELDFLCGGDNAGPKIIEVAEAKGAQYLDESQLINMIETDMDVPDFGRTDQSPHAYLLAWQLYCCPHT